MDYFLWRSKYYTEVVFPGDGVHLWWRTSRYRSNKYTNSLTNSPRWKVGDRMLGYQNEWYQWIPWDLLSLSRSHLKHGTYFSYRKQTTDTTINYWSTALMTLSHNYKCSKCIIIVGTKYVKNVEIALPNDMNVDTNGMSWVFCVHCKCRRHTALKQQENVILLLEKRNKLAN